MAQECPECGKPAPNKATACPHCAYPFCLSSNHYGEEEYIPFGKRFYLTISVTIVLFIFVFFYGKYIYVPKPEAKPKTYSEQHERVKNYFLSGKEPMVKDAVWTSETSFKVGLIDNGTSRDGYCLYVCEVLYEKGFKGEGVLVKAIDIIKLNARGKWETLGEAYCK